MTTAADDSAVEGAFEALLAGRPDPDGAAGLAAFTQAVRETATAPGRPNAALAELLATGLLVDQSSPSTRAARSDSASPSCGPLVRIRRRSTMILTTVLAKIAAGGAVAQASAGAGIVLVAVTGAGTAGVLPGPVQDSFATVVATVTPFEVATDDETTGETPTEETPIAEEPTEGTPVADEDGTEELPVEEAPADDTVVEEPGVEEPVAEEVWVDATAWATVGPIEGQPFGQWVSYGAKQGWADGGTVSCWAHARNDARKGRPVTQCAPAPAPEAPAEQPAEQPQESAPEQSAPVVEGGTGGSAGGGETAPVEEPVVTQQTTPDTGGNPDARGNGNGNGDGNGGGNGRGNGRN